jgi:DNA anti-recombination protein RmuC|tara:strand:- start:117 stop:341 length:225 start_codon:yes stop_codon:yes gene_type:complete
MKTEAHREEVIRLLTRLNERQVSIFKHIERIDKHLDKVNGKVAEHEKSLVEIRTWGGIAMFAVPIIVNMLMRVM